MTNGEKFFRRSPLKGYLSAVTASAFCLAFWPESVGFGFIIGGSTFSFFAAFILSWALSFFSAFLPFILVIFVGEKFRIKTPLYYAICGAIVGGLLRVICINVLPYTSVKFLETINDAIPFFLSGLVAGFTCWIVIRPR